MAATTAALHQALAPSAGSSHHAALSPTPSRNVHLPAGNFSQCLDSAMAKAVVAPPDTMNSRLLNSPHSAASPRHTSPHTSSPRPPHPAIIVPPLAARAGAVRATATGEGGGQAHNDAAAAAAAVSPAAEDQSDGATDGAAGGSAERSGGSGGAMEMKTCRRCRAAYDPRYNHAHACRYHPALFTGGERGKAVGFTRASSRPEDQLSVVHGTGLLRFWDCCGAMDASAPGCTHGRHVSFDELE
ncbi:hypothetical protein CLOP_g24427 [Closterium sp. NIES-67]|nr:hypothetical protein CLOP_g24427 [Closterium sp. NIES-67]